MTRYLAAGAIGLAAGVSIILIIAMALGIADAVQEQRIERPLS